MSDVREQLAKVIHAGPGFMAMGDAVRNADAILKHWDLTPKRVVTDEELGLLVARSYVGTYLKDSEAPLYLQAGVALKNQLDALGLRLVRVEEGE